MPWARAAACTTLALALAGCEFLLNDKFSGGDATASSSPDGQTTDGGTVVTEAGEPDGSASGENPYERAVTQDGPIGWWRLDDRAGAALAMDSTPAARHASIVNAKALTFEAPGALAEGGHAFVFDGTVTLELGDVFDFSDVSGPVPFSFEAWVKPAIQDANYRQVFGKMTYGATGPATGSYLIYNGSKPVVALERWDSDAGFSVQGTGVKLLLPSDRFTHVVVTHDGTTPRLYVDGSLANIGQDYAPVPHTTAPFQWARYWIGALDELAVYDKELSPGRVLAHYQAAQPSK